MEVIRKYFTKFDIGKDANRKQNLVPHKNMTTSRTVRIEGLRKSEPLDGEDENALYSLEASVLGSMPLSELWELVRGRCFAGIPM